MKISPGGSTSSVPSMGSDRVPRSPSSSGCRNWVACRGSRPPLAPFVHDSGDRKGERHIAGGRDRLRKSVYSAALPAAFRWNTQLITLYKRLTEAGKPHKLALVACARKLVIFANTVLARGTAWSSRPATC